MTARVLTASQMAALDRATIDDVGVPGVVLMERAALGVLAATEEAPAGPIVVLVGPGNNGGDGSAVARMLHLRGRDVTIVLAASEERLRGDAAVQLRIARNVGVPVCAPGEAEAALQRAAVLVDALLGIGQTEAPRGAVAEALDAVRRGCGRPFIVAVDVPTGVHTDTGAVWDEGAHADVTVTFAHRQFCHVLHPAAARCGHVRVHDIGVPGALLTAAHARWCDLGFARATLNPLPVGAHKGVAGHVAVVGGAARTPGASVLTATAALRTGAGLVTLLSSPEAHAAALAREPALMCRDRASAGPDAFDGVGCVVLGPGLGTDSAAEALARIALEVGATRYVLDADALTLAASGGIVVPEGAVLTPHPGELGRLLGRTTAEVLADLPTAVAEASARYRAVVVAKHAGALVGAPEHGAGAVEDPTEPRLRVVGGATPALATAGSGDVLAGIIGALALRHSAFDAAACGAWLHAAAGASLQSATGAMSATATRLIAHLDAAFAAVEATP